MKFYVFKPKNYPIITKWMKERILRSKGKIEITLDLGLSKESVYVKEKVVKIRRCLIPLKKIEKIDEKFVYFIDENCAIRKIGFFDRKYYKLLAIAENEAPTLEINGINMHRIQNITPWKDSKQKVDLLRISSSDRILDVCTGLGYTAIIASEKAKEVVTIEKDENVLKIAELNPWSRRLASKKIKIIVGDATKIIKEFEDNSFNKILHDPPRFQLAGELYSKEFYFELFRVLKKGGKLFHYTGIVGKSWGKRFLKGIKNRLLQAGFKKVTFREKERGFLCSK